MIKLLSGYRWDRGHGIILTNSLLVGWTDYLLLLYWYLLLIASLSLLTLFILHPHYLSFSSNIYHIYLFYNFSSTLFPNKIIKYLSSFYPLLLLSTSFYSSLPLYPPISTSLHVFLPLSTSVYFSSLLSTPLYLFLPLSTSLWRHDRGMWRHDVWRNRTNVPRRIR